MELNPEFADRARRRLARPFDGFDTVDPRVSRVPKNLPREEATDAVNSQMLFLAEQAEKISKKSTHVHGLTTAPESD